MLAELGLPSLDAAIGRTDLLEQARFDGCLDLGPMLGGAAGWRQGGRAALAGASGICGQRITRRLTMRGSNRAVAAYKAGEPLLVDSLIANEDRTFGARLAGELAMLQSAGMLRRRRR